MSDSKEIVPDWRRLFDSIRVPWIDHGANVGRNRINIKCPWCGNADPSYHLSIDTTKLVYYCQRTAGLHTSGHRGGAVKLLLQLGINYNDANKLLNDNASTVQVTREPTGITQDAVARQWQKFLPATSSDKVIDYLQGRGFPNALEVALRYDLRCATYGEWAGRLLIPITDNGAVVSWTGRAIFPHLSPKYKMQDVLEQRGLIYVGRTARRISIIVEGPIDALKINAACERLPISAAALVGLTVSDFSTTNPERLIRVRNFLQGAEIRLIAPDGTVPVTQVDRLQKVIAEFQAPGYYIKHLPIPDALGADDAGAMSYETIREWITGYCTATGDYNGAPPFR